MSLEEEIAALVRMVRFEEGERILTCAEGDVWSPGIENRYGIFYITQLRVGVSAEGSVFTSDAQYFDTFAGVAEVTSGPTTSEGGPRSVLKVSFVDGRSVTLVTQPDVLPALTQLAETIQQSANCVIREDLVEQWNQLVDMSQEGGRSAAWRSGIDILLTRQPNCVPALVQAGLQEEEQRNFGLAVELFQRAIAAGSLEAQQLFTKIAGCQIVTCDWSAALESANHAVRGEPNPEALKYRGVARIETGDLDGGLDDLRASASLQADDDGTWWTIGYYGRLHNDTEAVSLAVEKLTALAQINRARDFQPWLLSRQGEQAAAIRVAEEALQDGYTGYTMVMDYLYIVIGTSPKRALSFLPIIDMFHGDDTEYRCIAALACFAAREPAMASNRVRGLDDSLELARLLLHLGEGTSALSAGHPALALEYLRPWAEREDWASDNEYYIELHQYVCVLTAAAARKLEQLELAEQMLRRADRGAPIDLDWIASLQKELAEWTKFARAKATRSQLPPFAVLERLSVEFRASPRLAELAARLDQERRGFDDPPLIAVMGEYSVGKSTFINAWLGRQLLPTGEGATTGTITVLRYGEQERMRAAYRDGRVIEREGLASVAAFVKETGSGSAGADLPQHVDVFLRADVLRRISIVDSPGLNAPFEGHKEVTRSYLSRADAIVWLFSVENAGKSTESEFLAQLAHHKRKAVAVVNQIDLVPREEAAEVVADVQRDFASTFAHALGVSAKRALDAELKGDVALRERSGFPQLESLLDRELLASARAIKAASALQKAKELLTDLVRQREEYDLRTQKVMSEATTLRELLTRKAEAELWASRTKAASLLRIAIATTLNESAQALASRAYGGNPASPAATEPIARTMVTQVDQHWGTFTQSVHATYDLLQKEVLDGCARLGDDDLAAGLQVALAERRAELASWRKDLTDDVMTVHGFLDGYLAAGGLCAVQTELPTELRSDPNAVANVLSTRFEFLNARVVDATNRWTAAVHKGLRDSLVRLERELRKTTLDIRNHAFVRVEREAASLGLTTEASPA